MLRWIRPDGFKSFPPEGPALDLGAFTLLVGANAAGKSNLFDLIRFFQGLASGLTLPEVLHGVRRAGREVWPGIRGGRDLGFRGVDEPRPQIGGEAGGHRFHYGIDCVAHTMEPREEWFGGGEPWAASCVSLAFPGERGAAFKVNEEWEESGDRIAVTGTNGSLYLGAPLPPNLAAISPDPTPLRTFLQNSLILELSPTRMREYSPRGTTVLGAEGDGLSAVLREQLKRPEAKAELIDWVSELCAPGVADIDFIEVEGTGDVLLRLHESDGTSLTAQSVSDGTLRFLGILAALWSVPEGSLLCLEELEHGLHPARIDLLIELIRQSCARRGLQVIATTHSPRALHALGKQSPEQLGGTLVFGRSPGTPGTVVRPLRDLPAFEDVMKERGVEHLFTSRWMERAL